MLTTEQIDAAYCVVWTTVPHRNRLSAFAHHIAAEARRDALEEAARVCDEKHYDWRFGDGDDSASGPKECAAAIRKLKEDIE